MSSPVDGIADLGMLGRAARSRVVWGQVIVTRGTTEKRDWSKVRRPGPATILRFGNRIVAGVDEAGRGPLAGPVVAAAVILDPDNVPDGIADSKLLTPAERETLFAAILGSAIVSWAAASSAQIDRVNIRQATLRAMARAVAGLPCRPEHVRVDGNDPPSLPCSCETIVGGDASCASIAAASIVAKVARDRIMVRFAAAHPAYGFESHKGYSTPQHLEALSRLGPCAIHRMSFAPCAQAACVLDG